MQHQDSNSRAELSELQAELELLRRRSAFLEKASAILAGSLDFETTLSNVAKLAVPHIADWCAVDLCGGDYCDNPNELRRLVVTHVDPKKIELAYELERRYPPDPKAQTGAPHVVRTARPEYLWEIPEEMLAAAARDDEHLRIIRELGLRSYMVVPLVARDRTLGAISFISSESGRTYDESDLALAEDLASRAAMAIDNANLYKRAGQAEGALRSQLDFSNALMSNLADGVVAIDVGGRVTYVNPTAERLLGWRSEEMLGRSLHETIHHHYSDGRPFPVEECPLIGVIDTRKVHRSEEDMFIKRDGGQLPVEYISAPILSEGTVVGAVVSFHDITERKQNRERLEAQREWYNVTLSSIGDAVIATDMHGAVTFLNPVASALTGWKAEDAMGHPLPHVFHIVSELTHEPARNPVDLVLQTGSIVGLANHTLLISRDGHEVPIDDSAAPIRNSKGEVIGVILVFHDITDRKRSEDALRRSTQRTQRILESIDDAFVALDSDWRFTFTNKKGEEIFRRFTPGNGEIVGSVIWAEFPDLIWSDIYEQFHRAAREQAPVEFEMDAQSIGAWLSFHLYPGYDGLSVFIQDITERKRIDEERARLLDEAQESERRFRELVNTLAGVFWEADAKTLRFSFVSDRAEDILGYPTSEWLAREDFRMAVVHEDDRARVAEALSESIAAGRDHELEYRARAADGRTLKIRDIVYVVDDEHGVPVKLRGVMVDETEGDRGRKDEGGGRSQNKDNAIM